MVELVLTINKQIVNKYSKKVIKIVYKDTINKTLEYYKSISKTKQYNLIFKYTISSLKGYKIFRIKIYLNSIESLIDIKLYKDLNITQILVFLGNSI